MRGRVVVLVLSAILVAAVVGFAAVIATRSPSDRSQLWSEVGKGLLGLAIVGVLGTLLKLLADAYQERLRIEERRDEFRNDKYRRVVEATNTLRKAETLVNANRSVKTWSDQMLGLIDASNELRLIKHEIQLSSEGVTDPPFHDYKDIVWLLETMYRYTESVTEDFARNKKRLGELQRSAESSRIREKERAKRQAAVWRELTKMRSVADLLEDLDEDEVNTHVDSIENSLRADDRPAFSKQDPAPSRAKYEAAERLVLRRIAQAALRTKRASQPARSTATSST